MGDTCRMEREGMHDDHQHGASVERHKASYLPMQAAQELEWQPLLAQMAMPGRR